MLVTVCFPAIWRFVDKNLQSVKSLIKTNLISAQRRQEETLIILRR
jgi:hypothetical protein